MKKIGFSTILYLPQSAEIAVKKLGKKCKIIEILYEFPQIPFDWKAVKEMKNSYDLDISVHAPFYDINICSFFEPVRKISIKRIKESIKFCEYIEGDYVVLHPGHYPNFNKKLKEKAKKLFLKSMNEILNFGDSVKITLENESKAPAHKSLCYPSLEEMPKLLEEFGIKMTFDVGHAFITHKDKVLSIIKKYNKFIENFHLHDNNEKEDLHLIPFEKAEHRQIFRKIIRLVGNRKCIIEVGNKGSIYHETSNKIFQRCCSLLLKNLKNCKI